MTSTPNPERGGMAIVLIACCAIGALTVGATLKFAGGDVRQAFGSAPARKAAPDIATEEYGRRLIAQTPELLGPDVSDPKMRMMNSRLACGSCHLGTGTEPGTLSLLPATQHYPRFSARVGATTDIEDRVNECMQRSMNGRALAMDSPEMIAMAAYIRSLGARNSAMSASQLKPTEPKAFKGPDRAANLKSGADVFTQKCSACHGRDGLGLLASTDAVHGYVFPPLWGPDSFNTGAGLHRVLTAARFIKARMPLGKADLSDDEAFDVAAFINSQPRPEMPDLEADYPDRTKKPADNSYGPFADPFPLQQHQFGPFGPIEAFYKKSKSGK
jgi:thiosulfate dehydrogenase